MKTPKRKYYFYESSINPENGDVIMDAVTPGLYEARWKRKNRIKQLKRTIERLRWENFHMKIDLHIPVNISYDEYHSRRVDFTEKKPEPYFD